LKKTNDLLYLSASDLSNHIACPHLTYLNLRVANHLLDAPQYNNSSLELMEERGLEFEQAYLTSLKEKGLIISMPDSEFPSEQRTIDAMRAGADIIYQANLSDGKWQGRADFFKKVDAPSGLGKWSYEVIDSKLAKETRAGTNFTVVPVFRND
jgi:uncharacterized protein